MRTNACYYQRRRSMFDISSVLAPLRSLLTPVSIGWSRAEVWLGRKTFNASDRLMIYEDLAFLLDNNVKLEDAVNGMMANRREGTLRPRASVYCLQEVALALKQGKPLDVGLRRWIPRNEAAIIQSGVKEKRLADSLRRAIYLVLAVRDIRSTMLERLIQPLVLFFSLVALACMMSWNFLPQLESLKPRDQWQGSLVWMAVISDAFGQHLSLWIIGTLFIFAWVYWSFGNLTSRARLFMDAFPPWSIYREVQGATFLLNFAALSRAQVKNEDALSQLSLHGSPWLRQRLNAAHRLMKSGCSLGQSLADSGYRFPSRDAINRLKLLTQGDGGETIIDSFARNQLERTLAGIKSLAGWLNLLIYALSGLYMALVAFSTQNLSAVTGA
ncbi:general secretion pathway protein GspF [Salmonella enterica subsp. enterica serovar Bareilly]|nr:general secretion pathway protein GspF [Salmonella enterica subsp. enterica serovar Bareilly]ECD6034158.1 general secretion pathway protein GspF [Salmonella enterica subsp. enterica serovar Typhimurium]ECF0161784.1 general secretion pathway protein GspF [Salmonella enterica subsp. enterica serovar Litchfield]ECH9915450.1 general secretion pathway protein GspF [Salmonella enterica subsp. enterica]EEM2539764.1 general secretion pathway protein GspF [Salmonella enterica subsp. enterica serovar 